MLTLAQHKTDMDILKAVYTWNESVHTNLEWALTALKDTVDQLRAVNSVFYCNLDHLLEEQPQRIQAYLERCQKVNCNSEASAFHALNSKCFVIHLFPL